MFREVANGAFAPTVLAGLYVSGSALTEGVVHMYVRLPLLLSIMWLRFVQWLEPPIWTY